LNTELSARKKIQATGTLARSVLRYMLGIINRYQEELKNLDRRKWKMPTINGRHHTSRAIDRLYIPIKE